MATLSNSSDIVGCINTSSNTKHDSNATVGANALAQNMDNKNTEQQQQINESNNLQNTPVHKTPLDKRKENKTAKRNVKLDLKENYSPVRNSPTNKATEIKSIMKQSSKKGTRTGKEIALKSAPFSFNSPNSPMEAPFLSNNKGTPRRAHSTPVRSEDFVTTKIAARSRKMDKKKLNVNNCEANKQDITFLVRNSVVCCYKIAQQWQKTKQQGMTHLQEFVAQKLDSHGNVTKALNYIAVMHMSDLSEVLKNMCLMTVQIQSYVGYVTSLEHTEDHFATMKPFSSLSLSTIAGMLRSLYDRFYSEFEFKKKACNTLMTACGHHRPADHSADLLNNILSVWTNDVHIKRKDPHLVALMHEVKGFDDK